jgi:purine-binding chemotaxis protein CheW
MMDLLPRQDKLAVDDAPVLHVVFKVGDGEYVLPTATVVQIESYSGATAVPGAPGFVVGIVQIRGRIVPVVDLRVRFHLPHLEAGADTRIVVGQSGDRVVGLLVDSGREVLKISPGQIRPTPKLLEDEAGGYVKAVAQVGPRLLLVMDFEKVIGEEQLDVT